MFDHEKSAPASLSAAARESSRLNTIALLSLSPRLLAQASVLGGYEVGVRREEFGIFQAIFH